MENKRFNIERPRKEMINNEEKTFWDNVGKLVIFTKEGGVQSGILELASFDKQIKLNVFEVKPKQNDGSQPAPKTDYSQSAPPENREEEIKVENIPF